MHTMYDMSHLPILEFGLDSPSRGAFCFDPDAVKRFLESFEEVSLPEDGRRQVETWQDMAPLC
jgi:hypothetical protein